MAARDGIPITGTAAPGRSAQAGVTLIELLMGLALLAILVALARPTLQDYVADQRQIARVNLLLGHLQLARSEAVKRGVPTVVCPSTDGSRCADQALWHTGWLAFVDLDGDRQRGENEPLLVAEGAQTPATHITSGSRARIVYQTSGFAPGSNATFTFCDGRGGERARAIILSNTGRARVAFTQANGDPLQCPPP